MGVEIVSTVPRNRTQFQTTAQGLLSQNFERVSDLNTSILIGGTAYALLVGLFAGDVITNVYVGCQAAGNGTTLFKAGIYSLDGATLYASSANQNALFGSTGTKTVPLSAPWTVPADGSYMVVLVATASTTLPTLYRGGTSTVLSAIGSSALPFATAGTALSDLPAITVTYSTANSPIGYWVGLG